MADITSPPENTPEALVAQLAQRARLARVELARLDAPTRAAGLKAAAAALLADETAILAANGADMAAAAERGLSAAMLDRLRLDPARLAAMAQAVVARR